MMHVKYFGKCLACGTGTGNAIIKLNFKTQKGTSQVTMRLNIFVCFFIVFFSITI